MMKSIIVMFSIALCMGVHAVSASDIAKNTSYTLEDLGYNTKTIIEDDEIAINFTSSYSESIGYLDLHLLPMTGLWFRLTVKINNVALVLDEYFDINKGSWIRVDIPTGLIEKGANKLTIGFSKLYKGVTLFEDTKINFNETKIEKNAELEPINKSNMLKGSEDLSKQSNKNVGHSRLNQDSPDLNVTHVSALGVRITQETPLFPINIDIAKVNFTVKNVGKEAIKDRFYTDIYLLESNKKERVEMSYLGPGESFTKTVSFGVALASLIAKPVIVETDADNNISEVNEENNIKRAVAVIASA